MTNYGKFGKYLTRFKLKDNSICEHCKTAESDSDHILFNCEFFNQQRQEMVHQMSDWPLTHSQLISEKNIGYFGQYCKTVLN